MPQFIRLIGSSCIPRVATVAGGRETVLKYLENRDNLGLLFGKQIPAEVNALLSEKEPSPAVADLILETALRDQIFYGNFHRQMKWAAYRQSFHETEAWLGELQALSAARKFLKPFRARQAQQAAIDVMSPVAKGS